MLNITIEYFAQFRDLANKSTELLHVEPQAASDLYAVLAEKYQFPLGLDDVKVAVNEDFCQWGYTLKDGDTVVFIPPVAGG